MKLGPADRVYLIADTARAAGPPNTPMNMAIEAACAAGLRLVQQRDKDVAERRYVTRVKSTVDIAARHGARTLLNARWSLLDETGADGVHVPSALSVGAARSAAGSDSLVGYSAHSRDELRAAEDGGADFATLSPVFATESKPGAPALGLDRFTELVATCPLPVYALGGVTPSNAAACVAAGAFGVAVCGAILGAADPAEATRRLLEAAQ